MNTELFQMINQLSQNHFFGSLEIKFEAGTIVLVRKQENIKFNYREDRGKADVHHSR